MPKTIELRGFTFTEETVKEMEGAVGATLIAFVKCVPRLDPGHRRVAERLIMARLVGERAIYWGTSSEFPTPDAAAAHGFVEGVAESAGRYLDGFSSLRRTVPKEPPLDDAPHTEDDDPPGVIDYTGGFGRP
jgi:hypothetical protein